MNEEWEVTSERVDPETNVLWQRVRLVGSDPAARGTRAVCRPESCADGHQCGKLDIGIVGEDDECDCDDLETATAEADAIFRQVEDWVKENRVLTPLGPFLLPSHVPPRIMEAIKCYREDWL